MSGYYKLLVALLEANGYRKLGPAKGSHEKWGNGSRVTIVPFNCPSRHTANAILKNLKIEHKF